MRTNFRKIFSLTITLILVLSAFTFTTSATTYGNLLTTPPTDGNIMIPFGPDPPPTHKIHNVSTQGQYNFKGSSNSSTLYTEYQLAGKSSYEIGVTNTSNNSVTVKCISSETGKTLSTQTVSGNNSITFTLSTTGMFYISFVSPGFIFNNSFSVNGYVS